MDQKRQPAPESRQTQSRRTLLRASVGAAAGGLAIGSLRSGTAQDAATPTAIEGRVVSKVTGAPDAYTKLPEPYSSYDGRPASGGTVSALVITYDPPLTAHDDNAYWQELEKRLGVDRYEPIVVPDPNYDQRVSALVASGDLPDLVFLTPPSSLIETILQGAFADLTPYLSGENLKKYKNLAAFPQQTWNNTKLYGVPRPRGSSGLSMLWRQDWADTLGMPEPADADQFRQLLEGMTTGDPDGNGKADTYGLSDIGINVDRFMMHSFRTPNGWRLNDDGTLTAAVETDEYRMVMEFARGLMSAGVWHPSAATLTGAQATDLFNAGTVGTYSSGLVNFMGSQGRRAQVVNLHPEAHVVGVVPMGYDGGEPLVHQGGGFFGFTAIPAKVAQDKDRLDELLRILDYLASPFGSEEWRFNTYGVEGVHHTVYEDGTAITPTERGQREIGVLSGPQGILAGLTNSLPVAFSDVPGEALELQGLWEQLAPYWISDPTSGLYSPAEISSGPQLGQLVGDTTVSVITGREDMSAWDQMVDEWRSRGGDQVRSEYEDALAAL